MVHGTTAREQRIADLHELRNRLEQENGELEQEIAVLESRRTRVVYEYAEAGIEGQRLVMQGLIGKPVWDRYPLDREPVGTLKETWQNYALVETRNGERTIDINELSGEPPHRDTPDDPIANLDDDGPGPSEIF